MRWNVRFLNDIYFEKRSFLSNYTDDNFLFAFCADLEEDIEYLN